MSVTRSGIPTSGADWGSAYGPVVQKGTSRSSSQEHGAALTVAVPNLSLSRNTSIVVLSRRRSCEPQQFVARGFQVPWVTNLPSVRYSSLDRSVTTPRDSTRIGTRNPFLLARTTFIDLADSEHEHGIRLQQAFYDA